MPEDAESSAIRIAAPPPVIRVAIVEDRREIREGLKILIDGTEGYRCTGSFASMEDALDKIALELPDVVLVDIGLPGMSGIDGIRILRTRHAGLLLLMLTVYGDDERIFEALCAGACGYLLKKTPPSRLLDSLREALHGAPMSPEVAKRVLKLFREVRPAEPDEYDLTAHELKLLKLLVEGHNYQSAATELGV